MNYQTIPIRLEGSQDDARLITYLQDDSGEIIIQDRPLVLICPGGGYGFTSEREWEPLALQFLAFGCHAAVLKYSCAPARYPVALTELAFAVKTLREHAAEWHIDPKSLLVLGCSAGGHLAASLGVLWKEPFLAAALGLSKEKQKLLRPDGMILCYPVITGGEYAHRGSFECLLGEKEGSLERFADPESMLRRLSLETRVSRDTPPVFLWHTFMDGSVPVENSLLFVSALRKAGVSTEFHMYQEGGHGLSLANRLTQHPDGGGAQEECTSWISLVRTWILSRYPF